MQMQLMNVTMKTDYDACVHKRSFKSAGSQFSDMLAMHPLPQLSYIAYYAYHSMIWYV